MKTKILVLVVLMGMSVVMFAQPGAGNEMRPFHGKKGDVGMERSGGPMNGLNLTDAQKEAFKQSMLAVQKQMQPLRNQLGEAEAHQKTLMTSEKPDWAAINKNIEKIGEIKTEIAKLQAKHHLEMRAQLNDEQRLKFDMFKHQMKDGKGMKGPNGPKGQKGAGREMKHPMN
ncbi:MAG: Spy/CpxP family protein refolding chaperone [Prolixibacteraceae bacterium]|nr:Spy/CpxP family protein refolding chaperone [Prolixibacteraceae bacterium]